MSEALSFAEAGWQIQAQTDDYRLAALTPDWYIYLGPDDDDWCDWVNSHLPRTPSTEWLTGGMTQQGDLLRVDFQRVKKNIPLTVVA